MIRTQIQLPEPLYKRIKRIAKMRDWSLAEVVRRGLEEYEKTCVDIEDDPQDEWDFPTLDPSGGYVADPAEVNSETDAILNR
ncbi:MAG: ribbon-helix-helix domain-containing protein [Verrucomicrobiales bacterium]|nr:ribbon-helix-helix domain-containing protein [Verrucomicrobiales bacterium]